MHGLRRLQGVGSPQPYRILKFCGFFWTLFCYFDRRTTVMRFGRDFACKCRALLIKPKRPCHHLFMLLISTLSYYMCCRLFHSKTFYLCCCLHIHTMVVLSNEIGKLHAKCNKKTIRTPTTEKHLKNWHQLGAAWASKHLAYIASYVNAVKFM